MFPTGGYSWWPLGGGVYRYKEGLGKRLPVDGVTLVGHVRITGTFASEGGQSKHDGPLMGAVQSLHGSVAYGLVASKHGDVPLIKLNTTTPAHGHPCASPARPRHQPVCASPLQGDVPRWVREAMEVAGISLEGVAAPEGQAGAEARTEAGAGAGAGTEAGAGAEAGQKQGARRGKRAAVTEVEAARAGAAREG